MATPRPGNLPPMPEPRPLQEVFGASALPLGANAALVWQRFLPCWEPSGRRPLSKGKEGPLQLFVKAFNERGFRSAHGEALAAAHVRLDAAGFVGASLTATSPLIIGIGADHPLEVNLSFDPILGVPVIPGSGLKGLCRAWAQSVEAPDAEVTRILGPLPGGQKGDLGTVDGAGSVTFLDALPVGWPKLRVEVMTPHHSAYNIDLKKWLEKGPAERARAGTRLPIPGDWESPVPVPFLAVEAKSVFCFRLVARRGAAASDRETALAWLKDGLSFLGIGAKTAVGFGAFDG